MMPAKNGRANQMSLFYLFIKILAKYDKGARGISHPMFNGSMPFPDTSTMTFP
jgi:hypothetical protein